MKTARIVIGANNGDEGKGTIVAKYTKKSENVLNVLTNGGAQRGHSIITDKGEHTFHHFGSGTYHGASSYCSCFFVLNPMEFRREWDELVIKPRVFRDRSCVWSTPFDMIANTIEEELCNRHASCRMGIWNTINRFNNYFYAMRFDDFIHKEYSEKISILNKIREYYESNIDIPSSWKNIWESQYLIINFIEDCDFMYEHTIPVDSKDDVLLSFDNYIFENGQGLLIADKKNYNFDSTPSDTGIRYSKEIMKSIGLTDENCETIAHYVTRPYLTRHGDGFLFGESKRSKISDGIKSDRTNFFNEGQGEFRFGELDIKELKERIDKDRKGTEFVLEVTHCDEMDREKEFKEIFKNVETIDSPNI